MARGPHGVVLHSPVYADYAKCHDGRGAARHIHGDKNIAEKLAKNPAATYQVRDAYERHDGECDRKVCQREGDYQVV